MVKGQPGIVQKRPDTGCMVLSLKDDYTGSLQVWYILLFYSYIFY